MADAKPNTYFMAATDMPLHSRVKGSLLNAHTCINTATGFYKLPYTFGKTKTFTEGTPTGFEEIPANQAQPGDIVIFFTNKNGEANHAAMMDGISTEERYSGYPVEGYPQSYPVHVGDTLLNYSNGGRRSQDYRHSAPSLYNAGEELAGDDLSGPRYWYRYDPYNTSSQDLQIELS